MKKIITLAVVCLMTIASVSAQVTGQFIVAGHRNPNISIIDVESNQIVWQIPMKPKEQCNSVTMLDGGRLIAYTTQLGCKVVNLDKEVVFEYKVKVPSRSEAHSVVPMRGGGFAIFEAGTPAKIMEYSKSFKLVNEITFDGGEGGRHGQFRQAVYTKKGTWMVPCFSTGELREYDADGINIETYNIGMEALGLKEGPSDLMYIGSGKSRTYAVYNLKKKKIVKKFNSLKGLEFNFVYNAQYQPIAKDLYAVANWTGHRKNPKTLPEPQVIIFDNKDNVVWAWNDEGKNLGMVAGFYYSKKPIIKVE